jgi:cytochrome bd-type quinol oxidase subunit 2
MPNPGVFTIFDTTNQSVFINQSIINPHFPGLVLEMWIPIAVISAILTILAFWSKVRNEDGEVNPTRMGLTMIATVFNAFTSWLSVTVTIPLGCGVAIAGNQTVSICQNMVQEGGPIPYLFLLCTILCLFNGIYLNILPEMIHPELKVFDGPVSTKTQGEKEYMKRRKRAAAEVGETVEDDE